MRSGIADYTFDLLGLLATNYECTCVVADGMAGLRAPAGVPVLSLAEYEANERRLAASLHIYHIGNNPDHVYMLPVLARHPGVVVLHDPGLHNLLDCATAALGDIAGYCTAIEAEYGASGRVLADQFRNHELRDRAMLDRMPMLRHLLGPARHVVVHSRHAAHRALSHAPATPVTIAPHPYFAPAAAPSGAAWRRRWGIAADELVFLSLGFVSHIKRIDVALRAMSRIAAALPPFRYVIAGELRPEEIDGVALARSLGLTPHLVVTGYVPDQDFASAIAAADVVINLRHPVGGETSGTLIRSLGAGACVVVADEGPFAEIPNGAAVRLPWGPRIEAELADCLANLAANPARRRQIGAAAAEHTARRNAPHATLTAYRAAIEAAAAAADPPWRRLTAFGYDPPQNRPAGGPPLWQRLGAAPRGEPSAASLCVGRPRELAALRALGHAPAAARGWRPEDAAPYSLDFVFLSLSAGHVLLADPALLPGLNRALRHDGVLVISLAGLAPSGHPLASRTTGQAALHAAGFRVDLAAAAPAPAMTDEAQPGPEAFVWRATKISDAISLRPAA